MNNSRIGGRIRALRERAGMKQQDLADILELKDRQSVSAIEAGKRSVSADELIRLVERFGVSLQDLTNPFLLFDKDSFSWRQTNVARADLDAFEQTAGQWIGAYRALAEKPAGETRKLLPNLRLMHGSSFEDAIAAGEAVASFLELGDTPAQELPEAVERRLGILVLMVDPIPGISGAACHLPELDAILINRNESRGRRHADLSHELFHIMTWDTMRPERVESAEQIWDRPIDRPIDRKAVRNERIEQLADNFSFGVLMPSSALDKLPEPRANAEWLDAAADKLGVSSINLKWRMVNSKRAPEMRNVPNAELSRLARLRQESKPPLHSRPFLEALSTAIGKGDISVRRVAVLLNAPLEDIGEMFDSHGLSRPEELQF
ncbi:MAG: helix-turn-helix domain-containing protein [Paracoccaceae bacterium]